MSLFRTRQTPRPSIETAAQLFDYLRRSPDVKFLWAHQKSLLDAYNAKQSLTSPNVALELPTGSGKTLIGLLIGEYRRRSMGERIVYLCPTRQLCNSNRDGTSVELADG